MVFAHLSAPQQGAQLHRAGKGETPVHKRKEVA